MSLTRRNFLKGALSLIGAGALTSIPATRILDAIVKEEPALAREIKALTTPVNSYEAVDDSVTDNIAALPNIDATFEPRNFRIDCTRDYDDVLGGYDNWVEHVPSRVHIAVWATVEDNQFTLRNMLVNRNPVTIEFRNGEYRYVITGRVTDVVYAPIGKKAVADFTMQACSGMVCLMDGRSEVLA